MISDEERDLSLRSPENKPVVILTGNGTDASRANMEYIKKRWEKDKVVIISGDIDPELKDTNILCQCLPPVDSIHIRPRSIKDIKLINVRPCYDSDIKSGQEKRRERRKQQRKNK